MAQSKKPAKSASATQSNRSIEAQAIYSAGGAFVVTFLLSFLFFYGHMAPIFGRDSIGLMAAVLGTLTVFASYMVAAARVQSIVGGSSRFRQAHIWLTTGALAFIHAAVGFLLIAGAFFIVQDAFQGLTLDPYASATIVAITAGTVGYITYLTATQMTTARVSIVLAVFLVAGALTSMITAEDPYWWQRHFSALGASGTPSSYAFNLTLIIAGVVIVSLSDYVANDFRLLKDKAITYKNDKSHAIRVILALIGVFLAFVGLFAYDSSPLIHNAAAGGMAVLFVGLIVALPWLAPSFSRAFFGFSYALMGALLFCYMLWQGIGYFNLTTFELLAAAIIFSWLVVFIRQIAAAVDDQTGARTVAAK